MSRPDGTHPNAFLVGTLAEDGTEVWLDVYTRGKGLMRVVLRNRDQQAGLRLSEARRYHIMHTSIRRHWHTAVDLIDSKPEVIMRAFLLGWVE